MRVLLLQQGLSSLPTSAKNMALGLLPNVLLLILHQDLISLNLKEKTSSLMLIFSGFKMQALSVCVCWMGGEAK